MIRDVVTVLVAALGACVAGFLFFTYVVLVAVLA